MKIRTGMEVSAQSDIGCLRENNEDSFGYWEPESDDSFRRQGRLAVVADGMGGYEGGLEASRLAVATVIEDYGANLETDPQNALLDAVERAHLRIREHGIAQPHLQGMGTTCTAIAIVNGSLCYAHVGDTRLYLIRGGRITKLTRDHSYVGRLVESGVISQEEAEIHPQRNILTAALGTSNDPVIDSPGQPEVLHKDDVILICSDGLWGQVRDHEIVSALEDRNPEELGRELIRLARERGAPDNVTVVILKVE